MIKQNEQALTSNWQWKWNTAEGGIRTGTVTFISCDTNRMLITFGWIAERDSEGKWRPLPAKDAVMALDESAEVKQLELGLYELYTGLGFKARIIGPHHPRRHAKVHCLSNR